MGASSTRANLILYLLTAAIVISGFIYWQSDLTSDPPMYYSGIGQSLGTDPAQYIHHARNKVLFDDWTPYDYSRWTVYEHSLVSGLAYIWFSLTEVSIRNANMVGVLLSLGGLILILIGLSRHHRAWVLPAVALAWTMNVSLLTYGRLSYLENGLLFLLGLAFMIWCWWGDQTWGVALTGAVIAAAALTGKLFGVLMLPAVVAAIWCGPQELRRRHLIASVGGFVVGGILLIFALYGTDIRAAFGYAGEQAYGLRGFPDGLKSPWAFVEHLISYGYGNRAWYLDADLFVILIVGIGLLIMLMNRRGERPQLPRSVVLAGFWMAAVWLAMMPLNYSPLRYALMMFPAIFVFGFGLLDVTSRSKHHPVEAVSRTGLAALGLLSWWAGYQVIRNLFWFNEPVGSWLVWTTIAIGVVAALGLSLLLKRGALVVSRGWALGILAVMLASVVVVNTARVRRHHVLEQAYNIAEANDDLAHILNEGAVLSGAYGPVLTTNTPHHNFIHLFSAVADPDTALFDRYPVTHIAVEVASHAAAKEQYPEIEQAPFVTTFWIRDQEVRVYRLAGLFQNPEAAAYEPTGFELAYTAFRDGQIDSATAYLEAYLTRHPMTKSAGLLQTDLYLARRDVQAGLNLLTELADTYRTDFYIQMQCGRLYLMLGLTRNDPSMTELARRYFKRGVDANRFKGDFAMRLAQQTRQAVQGR